MSKLIGSIGSENREQVIAELKREMLTNEILEDEKQAKRRSEGVGAVNAVAHTPAADGTVKVASATEVRDGFKRRPPRERHYSVKPSDNNDKNV